jgi:hypothetical protein
MHQRQVIIVSTVQGFCSRKTQDIRKKHTLGLGSINFLNIGLQFWITSGVPVLRMRLFKAADHTKERDIVSSYSPDNPGSIQTREKK